MGYEQADREIQEEDRAKRRAEKARYYKKHKVALRKYYRNYQKLRRRRRSAAGWQERRIHLIPSIEQLPNPGTLVLIYAGPGQPGREGKLVVVRQHSDKLKYKSCIWRFSDNTLSSLNLEGTFWSELPSAR